MEERENECPTVTSGWWPSASSATEKQQWHRSEHKGNESRAGLILRSTLRWGWINILHSKYSIYSFAHFIQCALTSSKQEDTCMGAEVAPTTGVEMPTCKRPAASDDRVFSTSGQSSGKCGTITKRQVRGLCIWCFSQLLYCCCVSDSSLWKHVNTFICHRQFKSLSCSGNVILFPFAF